MERFPFVRDPHAAIICGQTGCGKTAFALDLLDPKSGPYRGVFESVFILCPTLSHNQTYLSRSWLWAAGSGVFMVDPKDRLHELIRALSKLFAGETVLFIIDDMSASKAFKKQRDGLSELAFSGRHRRHSVWVLSQRYLSVSKDLREQTQWVAVYACKDRDSFLEVTRENDVLPATTRDEIKEKLAAIPHAKLLIRTAWPPCYQLLSA